MTFLSHIMFFNNEHNSYYQMSVKQPYIWTVLFTPLDKHYIWPSLSFLVIWIRISFPWCWIINKKTKHGWCHLTNTVIIVHLTHKLNSYLHYVICFSNFCYRLTTQILRPSYAMQQLRNIPGLNWCPVT